jgi:hypothetical protein
MTADLNLQVVKDFAADVWEDLARTRLATVAVGLTIALLLTIGVVLRPGGTPDIASGSPAPLAPTPQNEVSFTVPSDEPMSMADVDLSAPRDPFRSLDGYNTASDETLLAADERIVDAVMGSDSSLGSTTAGADTTSSLVPLDDLSGGTAPTPAPTPGDPHADFDDPDEPSPAPATDYSYTADIQFGMVDDLKRYAHVQRLGLVPSRKLPLIMYLGVSTDHETAVFMVDSRLSQGGEGRCVPKDSLCTFLELKPNGAQDEHHFRDADGNEYLLRLLGLTRSTASSGSLSGRDVSALKGSPPVVDGQR